MSTEPKPATGEWTVETVDDLLDYRRRNSKAVAEAHNAALAAEREKREQARAAQHHMEACRSLLNVPDDEVLYGAIEELQSQLAAAQAPKVWLAWSLCGPLTKVEAGK